MNPKEIGFDEKREKWFSYKLSDGTTLRLKPILIKVLEEGTDLQGNPLLSLQTTNVIGISPSESIPIDELSIKKDDILFEEIDKDVWNEYDLDNGITLKLKPIIAQINRTGDIDPKGFPVYTIQAQTLIKQQR